MKNLFYILLFLPAFSFSQDLYEQAEKMQNDSIVEFFEYPVTFEVQGKEQRGFLQDSSIEKNSDHVIITFIILTKTDIFTIKRKCSKERA